jgi:hypothetical protein
MARRTKNPESEQKRNCVCVFSRFFCFRYQSVSTFAELKQKWSPSDMLPKCYLDREVREINKAWKIL